jgi:hypothetical protein
VAERRTGKPKLCERKGSGQGGIAQRVARHPERRKDGTERR